MLWWALAIGAVVAVAYAGAALKNKEKGTVVVSAFVAIGALVFAYVYRKSNIDAPSIPIYSYGVMLGLSLVVGWYLTLTLADRDGLPKETMANCYVFTALAAIAGSRVLYVLTNLDEFHSLADIFAFRRGGLVAYGGFIGGYLGSWLYLKTNGLRLLASAATSLAAISASGFRTRRPASSRRSARFPTGPRGRSTRATALRLTCDISSSIEARPSGPS
jgi:phosphatidylglycerol:prolipoprotein diacylglycerol transferase